MVFSQNLSVTHGHGPPMMSTMSGQRGRLSPSAAPMAGGSPSVSRQKLSTTRGTGTGRQKGLPISDNGPPLPPRNTKK